MRELCATYARAEPDEARKAKRAAPEAEKAPDAVEQGKKVLKGLFGR